MRDVEIFTDGACSGNPGPGGWGAILKAGTATKELSGGVSDTTNNRMEMLAAIKALSILKERCRVVLTTDSQYLRQGITQWIHGWKRNGWKTASKSPVKNKDLWQKLDKLMGEHDVTWEWVKGHAEHPENERCDELARMAIKKLKNGHGGGFGGKKHPSSGSRPSGGK